MEKVGRGKSISRQFIVKKILKGVLLVMAVVELLIVRFLCE